MNAPFVKPQQQSTNNFAAMNGQVVKWRGECIQYFAELEQIIETVLLSLSAVARHGSKVSTGQHIGTALKQLRDLTGRKGPFANKGKALNEALAEIAPWFEWRAHLTHGVITIWCGDDGKWLIASAHRSMGDHVIRSHALTWEDACELRKVLDEGTPTVRERARLFTNSVEKA